MDKTYYITEIEQAIGRIRAGMNSLRDIDNNFAALASGLTKTAEWVEAHAPMKGYRSVEPSELEGMMLNSTPVQVLTHRNRWEQTYIVGFTQLPGNLEVEVVDPYTPSTPSYLRRITISGEETVKSHIRVSVPPEDKEDEQ